MTKNRASKRATRQRVALTGERYVVAQRAAAEPQVRSANRAHELMHTVPGVPAHVAGGLQRATRVRNSNPRRQQPRRNEPRVLVAWQNWIARRLGVGARSSRNEGPVREGGAFPRAIAGPPLGQTVDVRERHQ
jgi:hypothetical protein